MQTVCNPTDHSTSTKPFMLYHRIGVRIVRDFAFGKDAVAAGAENKMFEINAFEIRLEKMQQRIH